MKNANMDLGTSFDGEVKSIVKKNDISCLETIGEAYVSGKMEKKKKGSKRSSVKRKKEDVAEKLYPLKVAAERIADMLCGLSGDEELFVISQNEKQSRRIDTKTLKEFSSVIKEITGVICELNGISPNGVSDSAETVKIEFDEEAEACSQ